MSKRARPSVTAAADVVSSPNEAETTAVAASSPAAANVAAKPAKGGRARAAPKPNPAIARFASTRHWLMKNEPPYSLAALQAMPNQTEPWVGVRNREARNMMQYGMQLDHQMLYYNASIANPHIAGVARVSSAPYADPSAFDNSSAYFDAKSNLADPTWFLIDVRFENQFARPVYLAELRHCVEAGTLAADFTLFRKKRLSIHPLTPAEYAFLVAQADTPLPPDVKLKKERAGGVAAHPSRKRTAKPSTAKKAGSKRKQADSSSEEEASADDAADEDEPPPSPRAQRATARSRSPSPVPRAKKSKS